MPTPSKIIWMYHSVTGPRQAAVPGSVPVTLEMFARHIETAGGLGYAFGRISRLSEPVRCDTIYITSDDGTVDWARNALPYCEARAIPTHTAVITGPWHDPPCHPVAHRLQIMLSLQGGRLPVPVLSDEQRAYIDEVYGYEQDLRRRYLKGACNVVLDDRQARALLGQFSKTGDGAAGAPVSEHLASSQRWIPPGHRQPAAIAESSEEAGRRASGDPCEGRDEVEARLAERFAGPECYRGLRFAEVGVHTVSHRAFDGDANRYLSEEILPALGDLERAGLQHSSVFTLPMSPRHPAKADDLVAPLRQAGFKAMLTAPGVHADDPFIIRRIDARQIDHWLATHQAASRPAA